MGENLSDQVVDQEQLGLMNDLLNLAPEEPVEPQEPAEPIQPQEPIEPQIQQPTETQQPAQPVEPQQIEEPAGEAATIQALREEIARLTGLLPAQAYPAVQTPEQPAQPAAQVQQPAQPATPQQPVVQAPSALPETFDFKPGTAYLNEQELDAVIDNPKLLLTAIERAQKDVVQQMLGLFRPHIQDHGASIPEMVRSQVANQIAVTKAITDFYDANTDLRPHAQYTQLVMSEVERSAVGTGKTYSQIFDETATIVRKRLGLPSPTAQSIERGQTQRQQQRPAFAGSRGGGTGRPAGSPQLFDPAAADMLP